MSATAADLLATLTPEEAASIDTMQAALRTSGYVDIEEHCELRPGARVYHRGHQWPGASTRGTGVVLVLLERPNSPWSASWRIADVELAVLWDKPSFGSRLSWLAQYHVHVAEEQA